MGLFNRKSTDHSQAINRLNVKIDGLKSKINAFESQIRLFGVEIADYNEKTRRLYLRINKRMKDDIQETSDEIPDAPALTGTAMREEILRQSKFRRG